MGSFPSYKKKIVVAEYVYGLTKDELQIADLSTKERLLMRAREGRKRREEKRREAVEEWMTFFVEKTWPSLLKALNDFADSGELNADKLKTISLVHDYSDDEGPGCLDDLRKSMQDPDINRSMNEFVRRQGFSGIEDGGKDIKLHL